MAKIKIIQDRKKCIGCGVCAAVCPENWELKKDGKASPKKTQLDKIGCNKKAADACPVHIIKIIEK
ncbi:MAG: Ferredoxin [Parcubacteria group bacterium GW2011_GWA1_45_7]|nr:MAG: Ferredoxin [Parcubacteria group bacterium GW2011_GWA1_45_7]KKU11186.1 MAG: Ferredoxin [Parcubacteria group bacterium GW2011_GWF1_45_5]KKU47393.1 MAG: Ferredoxin [Parcubacteria group bacterium GW2011_GWF2_46_8]